MSLTIIANVRAQHPSEQVNINALDQAVRQICDRWNPARHDHSYTLRLFQILARYYSFATFGSVVNFLQGSLLRSHDSRVDDRHVAALSAPGQMTHMATTLQQQDNQLWLRYKNTLLLAMTRRDLAVQAFKQLLQILSTNEAARIGCQVTNAEPCDMATIRQVAKRCRTDWEDIDVAIMSYAYKHQDADPGAFAQLLKDAFGATP